MLSKPFFDQFRQVIVILWLQTFYIWREFNLAVQKKILNLAGNQFDGLQNKLNLVGI